MNRNCNLCGREYFAEKRYLNRGQGIYCSLKCASIGNKTGRPKLEPNVVCAGCQVQFYCKPSRLGKSKSRMNFCKRSCKDNAQRIGGLVEIMPPHYGVGVDYRSKAFREYPHECKRCGYKKHPDVLQVNHIDCDKSNNNIENLEILCPTCHSEYHFMTKTGPWRG